MKRIGTVLLVLFLDIVGFSIIFPLSPALLRFYDAQQSGMLARLMTLLSQWVPQATEMQRAAFFGGVLAMAYSFLQFLCSPVWGGLSDRFGRRPVLTVTVSGTLIANAAWIFAGSFEVFLATRLVAGIFAGNISTATAAVADLSDSGSRARAMGLAGACIGLGFISGPALGGMSFAWLPDWGSGRSAHLALTPFSATVALAASLNLVSLVWVVLAFKESLPDQARHAPGRSMNPFRLVAAQSSGRALTLNSANFLNITGFAAVEATLAFLLTQRLGFRIQEIALCMSLMGICSALTQGGAFRALGGRVSMRATALGGLFLMIPGYLLLGAVDWHPWGLLAVLGIACTGVGMGLTMPALGTLVSFNAGEKDQGAAMGSFRAAGALGRTVGPLLGAFLYFRYQPGSPYLASAVLGLAPLLLVWSLAASQEPARPRQVEG